MHRNTITAVDNVTVIITKANRVTKVNEATTATIINIKAKVVAVMAIITSTKVKAIGAMAIIISMVTKIKVITGTTGVMVTKMAVSITKTEDTIDTDIDTTDPTGPMVITDPTLMATDQFITRSPTIHMYRLHLI